MIEGVVVSPLKIIDVSGGDVLHVLKHDDLGFAGFGEAYFSTINAGEVKAWKRHKKMVTNLVVPVGIIRFVLFDERKGSASCGTYYEIVLSRKNYSRLTIPPMIWFGFQSLGEKMGIVLNIASIKHVAEESEKKEIKEIPYDWSVMK
ncbi:MAG: dTDP-4-dehydrorhamnose 3,5-epimerase [Nitrosomonadaceae bacterium]|nr:dTDP-4-dehydrorhamnose 3,5-epimerase [Nitrosomonadaceae bacterium]